MVPERWAPNERVKGDWARDEWAKPMLEMQKRKSEWTVRPSEGSLDGEPSS